MIQKKDKRLHVRRNDKDDASHLSDEDTDPRQYKRAEEQATRSARVLYMIERQVNYHLFCLLYHWVSCSRWWSTCSYQNEKIIRGGKNRRAREHCSQDMLNSCRQELRLNEDLLLICYPCPIHSFTHVSFIHFIHSCLCTYSFSTN